ncbi:MAG: hypothetical protein ABIQ44_02220 [Chloroflexia bacterium]
MHAPLLDDDLGLLEAVEDLAVEEFVAKFCSEIPVSRQASWADFPWPIVTSICRSSVTIYSELNLFFGMTKLLSKTVSNIPLGTKRARQLRNGKVSFVEFEGFPTRKHAASDQGTARCKTNGLAETHALSLIAV